VKARLDGAYERLLTDLERFRILRSGDTWRAAELFLGGPSTEPISERMHYTILDWMAF
jgi:hypothetical protein